MGPISYHLGCDVGRDDDGALHFVPKNHIETIFDCYYNMFVTKPKLSFSSPLEKGDHTELDTSECLDLDDIQKHQSMIGTIQWTISLGRLEVNTAEMTLASFRDDPRQGHLDRCKKVVSYLAKFKCATIRIRTAEPDTLSTPTVPRDWEESVCGKFKELSPHDAPASLEKHVVTISYYDDNMFHNVMTGR